MKIESYEFGKIIIDGEEYIKDLIILQDKIISDWCRKEGHSLSIDDLKEALLIKAKKIIIGTGHDGLMTIPTETIQSLRSESIKIDAADTRSAIKYYEESNKEKTVLALHLTC